MISSADFLEAEEKRAEHVFPNGHDKPRSPLPAINRADVVRWRGREPPDLLFTIEDLVPAGMVTLLTGQGGAGKTLLLQLAGTVIAAGTLNYLGKAALAGRAAGVFAEDPEAVLHIRQPRINEYLNIDYDRIAGRYFPQSYFGLRAQLWRDGRVTPFFGQLEQELAQIDALRAVSLDNAATLYSGDENSRPEVTEFLSEVNGFADRLGIAVILSAHPSKSQDGTALRVTSGTTAWVNASRSVLELKAGDDQKGPSLTVVKANHAATGTTIPLVWQDRLLVPEGSPTRSTTGYRYVDRIACESVFLALLDKVKGQGRYVNDSKNSGHYAPRVFVAQPKRERDRYRLQDFEEAMERLFGLGAIRMEAGGRKGSPHSEIVRAEDCAGHV